MTEGLSHYEKVTHSTAAAARCYVATADAGETLQLGVVEESKVRPSDGAAYSESDMPTPARGRANPVPKSGDDSSPLGFTAGPACGLLAAR